MARATPHWLPANTHQRTSPPKSLIFPSFGGKSASQLSKSWRVGIQSVACEKFFSDPFSSLPNLSCRATTGRPRDLPGYSSRLSKSRPSCGSASSASRRTSTASALPASATRSSGKPSAREASAARRTHAHPAVPRGARRRSLDDDDVVPTRDARVPNRRARARRRAGASPRCARRACLSCAPCALRPSPPRAARPSPRTSSRRTRPPRIRSSASPPTASRWWRRRPAARPPTRARSTGLSSGTPSR